MASVLPDAARVQGGLIRSAPRKVRRWASSAPFPPHLPGRGHGGDHPPMVVCVTELEPALSWAICLCCLSYRGSRLWGTRPDFQRLRSPRVTESAAVAS